MSKIENYYNGCLVVSTYGEAESHELFCDGVSDKERAIIAKEQLSALASNSGLEPAKFIAKRIAELKENGSHIGSYTTLAAAIRATRGLPTEGPQAETDPDEIDTEVINETSAG
jgi:hypothetical protein